MILEICLYFLARGFQSSIPKPVIEALDKLDSITFEINGKNIRIKSGTSNS